MGCTCPLRGATTFAKGLLPPQIPQSYVEPTCRDSPQPSIAWRSTDAMSSDTGKTLYSEKRSIAVSNVTLLLRDGTHDGERTPSSPNEEWEESGTMACKTRPSTPGLLGERHA
ncbi:hypothetical protein FKM82_028698 [Ascaphus truei]